MNLLMLLKGFDFGAGLALGEASPGAFGAVACPAWFDELEPPVTLEPFFLVLSACAFETCGLLPLELWPLATHNPRGTLSATRSLLFGIEAAGTRP